jgi:hypothetical protein
MGIDKILQTKNIFINKKYSTAGVELSLPSMVSMVMYEFRMKSKEILKIIYACIYEKYHR